MLVKIITGKLRNITGRIGNLNNYPELYEEK